MDGTLGSTGSGSFVGTIVAIVVEIKMQEKHRKELGSFFGGCYGCGCGSGSDRDADANARNLKGFLIPIDFVFKPVDLNT
jgi:hypothetical protein